MYINSIQAAAVMVSVLPVLAVGQTIKQEDNPILLLSTDASFHFELGVALGESIYGGADIGPILGIAKDLEPGDIASWDSKWFQLAQQTKMQAEDPRFAYDAINVRDTWFSAATYFRRADFYNHGNWSDPRINDYWAEQTAAFDKGLASLPVPGHRFQIPADGFKVEAIWYPVSPEDGNCTKKPTLVIGSGYDGSQEDLYHFIVVPALARGWNCITYEGPGQPSVRRGQNIGFIHDWERVITPIVDHLLSEKSSVVDANRLVLFGVSFGGFLSARAAAFEHRFAAVMLDEGIYSFYDGLTSILDPSLLSLFDSGNQTAFDAVINQALAGQNMSTTARWGIEQGLWSFNIKSPYEWLQAAKAFTLDGITDMIQTPVWTADAQYEGFFPGQSAQLKKALGDRATYQLFNNTAGYHCQMGAMQEMSRVVFAWLHETLG